MNKFNQETDENSEWEKYEAEKKLFELRKRHFLRIAKAKDIPSTIKAFQSVMSLYALNGCTESEVKTLSVYLDTYAKNIERMLGKELNEKVRALQDAFVVLKEKAENNVRGTTFNESADIYTLTGMK